MPGAGEDKNFAVFGGLDCASGGLVWRTSAAKNGAAFVRFLDQVAQEFPDAQVVAVLDNAGYVGSHKSHALRRRSDRTADRSE